MRNIQLSERKISQLATEISDRLFESHYFHQGTIGGEALKNFCEFDQVNKFLLFQLYQVWQLQISRFKHPYFDFSQPEIDQLLTQLQNMLSKNIAISQNDFKPLLKKAVYNNLKLLLFPKSSLEHFFFQHKEKINIELFEKYSPFFSDFGFAIISILRYFQKNKMEQVEKDIFSVKFDKLVELYNQKSDQDIDAYRALRIYKLTNKHIDDIIKEDQAEKIQLEQQRKEEDEAQKAAEAKKRKEEEAKAAAEAAKAEAAKKEEEAARLRKSKSFFDTLDHEEDVLLELDEDSTSTREIADEKPAPEPEPTIELKSEPEPVPEVASEPEPEPVPEVKSEPEPSIPESPVIPEEVIKTQADKLRSQEEKDTIFNKLNEKQEETEKKASTIIDKFVDKGEPQSPHEQSESASTVFSKLNDKEEAEAKEPQKEEPITKEPDPEPIVIDIIEEPVEEKEPKKEAEEDVPVSILDKFKEKIEGQKKASSSQDSDSTPRTIADRFTNSGPAAPPTADGKPIKPDEIPIHKQYQYVQKVFGGNNVRFRIIVDKVNNSNTAEEVEEILNKYVFGNSDVNKEEATVKEFAALMRSRF